MVKVGVSCLFCVHPLMLITSLVAGLLQESGPTMNWTGRVPLPSIVESVDGSGVNHSFICPFGSPLTIFNPV